MARKRNEKLKQALLLAFVLASVLLIGLIWANGLRAGEDAVPGYYRELDGGAQESAPATLPASQPGSPGEQPTPDRNLDAEEM